MIIAADLHRIQNLAKSYFTLVVVSLIVSIERPLTALQKFVTKGSVLPFFAT